MGQARACILRKFGLAVGVVVALGACAQNATYAPVAELIAAPPPPALSVPYRLGPGDEVEIKFFFAPELNDRLIVRPDGKISLMFAQEIKAAGRTPRELAADIRSALAKHVKQLDLVVVVRTFASHKAYVGGEVLKPGLVPLNGSETVLQVLATAGWKTPFGGDTIVIVRRDGAGLERVYAINLDDLQNGRNMEQDVAIHAGDIVLVPPSDAVASNRWVDQYIRQMLPFSTGVGVYYNINSNPRSD